MLAGQVLAQELVLLSGIRYKPLEHFKHFDVDLSKSSQLAGTMEPVEFFKNELLLLMQ